MQELKHRQVFTRSKLEDSCLHGFYVIGNSKGDVTDIQKDTPAAILTRGKQRACPTFHNEFSQRRLLREEFTDRTSFV